MFRKSSNLIISRNIRLHSEIELKIFLENYREMIIVIIFLTRERKIPSVDSFSSSSSKEEREVFIASFFRGGE